MENVLFLQPVTSPSFNSLEFLQLRNADHFETWSNKRYPNTTYEEHSKQLLQCKALHYVTQHSSSDNLACCVVISDSMVVQFGGGSRQNPMGAKQWGSLAQKEFLQDSTWFGSSSSITFRQSQAVICMLPQYLERVGRRNSRDSLAEQSLGCDNR